MRGARSLATSWPVSEKLWWEAPMEQPGPCGGPLSAKAASFQVGKHGDLGQRACLSKLFLCTKGVNSPQGSKAISDDSNPALCGAPREKSCHHKPRSEGLGCSRAAPTPPHRPHSPPSAQLEAPQKLPPSVGMGSPGGRSLGETPRQAWEVAEAVSRVLLRARPRLQTGFLLI